MAAVLGSPGRPAAPTGVGLGVGAAPPPPPPPPWRRPAATCGSDVGRGEGQGVLLPRTGATLDGHSATTDEALNAAGVGLADGPGFVAFRWKHLVGYLRRAAPRAGDQGRRTPYSDKELLPPGERSGRLAQAAALERLGSPAPTIHRLGHTPPAYGMLFVVRRRLGDVVISAPNDLDISGIRSRPRHAQGRPGAGRADDAALRGSKPGPT